MLVLSPERAEAQDLLEDIPVTGTVGGQTFEGVLTITELVLGNTGLLASGVLKGTVNGTDIVQEFSNVALDLGAIFDSTTGECTILTLDLGPIHLDVLGLQVDLSEVELDVTAVTGDNRLLGNLLCAIAGLLNNFSLTDLLSNIISELLEVVNELL